MELVGTPLSHFTRKVRLVLDHLGQDYDFIDVGNVADADQSLFADNPLMSVPVLRDQALTLFDSDHIAAYIVRRYDPQDRFNVLTTDPNILNARAILNGAMAAEVRLVLAERTGLKTDGAAYFDKSRAIVIHALDWCEARVAMFNPERPDYLGFHFISCWDHIHAYQLAGGDWPGLSRLADRLSQSEQVRRSSVS